MARDLGETEGAKSGLKGRIKGIIWRRERRNWRRGCRRKNGPKFGGRAKGELIAPLGGRIYVLYLLLSSSKSAPLSPEIGNFWPFRNSLKVQKFRKFPRNEHVHFTGSSRSSPALEFLFLSSTKMSVSRGYRTWLSFLLDTENTSTWPSPPPLNSRPLLMSMMMMT